MKDKTIRFTFKICILRQDEKLKTPVKLVGEMG